MRLARPFAAVLLTAAASTGAIAQRPASWVNVGPPGWGYGTVAADPADARHIVVLDGAGQLRESRDRGTTWSVGAARACVTSDVLVREGAVYASCGGVLRTTDSGASWVPFILSSPGSSLSSASLQVDWSNPKRAVALVGDLSVGLVATVDGGRTWRRSFADASFVPAAMAFDPATPGRLIAIADGGQQTRAWESFDTGASWSAVATLLAWPAGSNCFSRAIAARGASLYAVTDCGVAYSSNGGRSWSMRDPSAMKLSFLPVATVRADPSRDGHAVIFSDDKDLAETVDGGVTWTHPGAPPGGARWFDFAPDGTLWASGSTGPFRRDAVGAAWVAVDAGTVRAAWPVVVTTGGQDGRVLFTNAARSSDGGLTWSTTQGAVPTPVLSRPTQFYRFNSGGTQRSDDGGATWQDVSFVTTTADGKALARFIPVGPQPGVIYAAAVAVSSCVGGVCFTAGVEALRSADGGRSWASIDRGLTGLDRTLAATGADPRVAYVTTSDGVFRTADAGATWKRLRDAVRVLDVVPDLADAATVYVRTDSGVSVSADGGVTWGAAAMPNLRTGISAFAADPLDAGRAYAVGVDGATFETRDRAATWRQLAIGEANVVTPSPTLSVSAAGTRRTLVRVANTSLFALQPDDNTLALDSDLWLNAAEPGWGLSITQPASGQIFAVWYHYDAQGKPTWSFVSGGTWADSRTFTGTLYSAKSSGYFNVAFDPASVTTRPIGTATLRFSSADAASMSIAFNDGSPRFERAIVRYLYGPASRPSSVDISGLWWNSWESGWGVTIGQQYGTAFAAWFLYDADGNPTWLYASDIRVGMGGAFSSGDLYAATGPAFPGPYDPAKVVANKVGSLTWIPGQVNWMRYTVSGAGRDVAVSRLPF